MKPDVTIFADASVMPKHERAGWGGWAKGDNRFSVWGSGKIVFPVQGGSNHAEAIALEQMVAHLIETGYFLDSDKCIMLQSDNMNTLGVILHRAQNAHASRKTDCKVSVDVYPIKGITPYEDVIERLLQHLSFANRIVLRHVKGHVNNSKAGRQWVNNRCDELAKRAAMEGSKCAVKPCS